MQGSLTEAIARIQESEVKRLVVEKLSAGVPPAVTRLAGSTSSAPGAVPKLHMSIAPAVT